MYAFGSNELTNSSRRHNGFPRWTLEIYSNEVKGSSSRAWLIFTGSGRLVNRGTIETEGPRCALLLVSFALHSSGWKVFVGYRNCHSCYKCVLYFVDVAWHNVVSSNVIVLLYRFGRATGGKEQRSDFYLDLRECGTDFRPWVSQVSSTSCNLASVFKTRLGGYQNGRCPLSISDRGGAVYTQ